MDGRLAAGPPYQFLLAPNEFRNYLLLRITQDAGQGKISQNRVALVWSGRWNFVDLLLLLFPEQTTGSVGPLPPVPPALNGGHAFMFPSPPLPSVLG